MGEVVEYKKREGQLERETVERIEKDLRCYPDWIIRLEVGGLGIPSRNMVVGGAPPQGFSGSFVEDEIEVSEEIKRKVAVIEAVYDRLHGRMKDIIELRYFQAYSREDVIKMVQISSKRQYYNLRDRAMICFARAFGYII